MASPKRHTASGAVITGAGGTTAGIGLLAGGLPGVKSNFAPVESMKSKPPVTGKNRVVRGAKMLRENPGIPKTAGGGILGHRVSAHEIFVGRHDAAPRPEKKPHNNVDAFYRGYNEGKAPAELKVIDEMKRAKRLSNVALVGGVGAAAYGVHRMHQPVQKSSSSDKYNGVLLGAGATGAGFTHGATKVLNGQKKRWANVAIKNTREAEKIVPGLGGTKGDSMYPAKRDGEMWAERKTLRAGVGRAGMNHAGLLRGEAGQARHFAEVYDSTSKVVRRFRNPSLAVAAAGAGGLALTHHKNVSKRSMSDAELRHRKKVQGAISRTTSTLGLTGAGLLLASTKPGRSVLRKIPKVETKVAEVPGEHNRIREAAQNVGMVSGGIGAAGGFNFASYTAAESKRKKQAMQPKPATFAPVRKSHDAFVDVSKAFDAEKHRLKRADAYSAGSLAVAGAGGALTAHHGLKYAEAVRSPEGKPYGAARAVWVAGPKTVKGKPNPNPAPQIRRTGRTIDSVVSADHLAHRAKAGRATLASAALAGAGVAGHRWLAHKKSDEWQPYAKSLNSVSAFGVVHD